MVMHLADRMLCSKGKRGKWSVHRRSPMRRPPQNGLLVHVSVPIVAFLLVPRLPPRSTPSSSYPLLATCLLLTDRGEKIMNRSYSSSSFFEIQSQLQQSCSCKMEIPFLRLFFLLNRLFFFIGYSEIIVVNIVYFVLYCSFELEWIDVSQWLRDKTWLVPSKGAFFILTCWKKESWSASRIRISSSSETSKLCFTHTFVTHVSNDVAHVIRLVPSKFFDVKSFPDYDR